MDFDAHIEIPAKSSVKYEVDEKTGGLRADRFLHTAMVYPFNYGYIKDTLGEDNDPLDVVVISSQPIHPGVVVKCHTIGLLEMEDEGGIDTKIIAVPDGKVDPLYGSYTDIKNCPQHMLDMIKHFFDHMKELEAGKWVKTGDSKGAAEAEKELKAAQERASKGK